MKLSYFLEIFLQQSYMHVCNGPKLPKYENTEKSRLDGDFIGKQCLLYWIQRRNTFRTWFCHRKHVFCCEKYVLHTILTITAYKA